MAIYRHCEPTGIAFGDPEDRLREAIQSNKLRARIIPEEQTRSETSAELLHPSLMPTAFKLCREKAREAFLRLKLADQPRAEGQNIRIIMEPRKLRPEGGMAERRARPRDTICSDGDADAGTADGKAEACLACRYRFCNPETEIGIINRIR